MWQKNYRPLSGRARSAYSVLPLPAVTLFCLLTAIEAAAQQGVEPGVAATPSSSAMAKPKGPAAVAAQDPNRVVAIMGGSPIIARQALAILNALPPQTRVQYRGRVAQLVEKLYMEGFIAIEATTLRLNQREPLQTQLAKTRIEILGGAMNYPSEPDKDLPPQLVAKWYFTRNHMLWEAYFAQAATPEAREALLKQKTEQYRLEVKDPDFFDGVF